MLAKRRAIKLNGTAIERTPLLVPSFSSKGFPEVAGILEFGSDLIDSAVLLSAYDLYYGEIKPPFTFPSLIFLDSGGYEASKDNDLSDFGDTEHHPRDWAQQMYDEVLGNWNFSVPTVLISFDHPKQRIAISEQISRAHSMWSGRSGFVREILLKPESEGQRFLQMDNVIAHIHALSDFDVIGVTEKEVGPSLLERMKNIAQLRVALDTAGLDKPIHVFGSLDPVTTPLYFLAGADIFDGLTWLRFAYVNGQTVYKHNYAATAFALSTRAHMIDGLCWNHNYYYLIDLQLEMRGFLTNHDFRDFKHNGELFRTSLNSTMEAIGVQYGG
jgi:hypothetical protein